MASCRRPGCSGTIESGYCDVCGHGEARRVTMGSPVSAGGIPVEPRPVEPRPVGTTVGTTGETAGEGCVRPGCGGDMVDGYCTVCGHAPAGGSSRVSATPSGPVPGDGLSASTPLPSVSTQTSGIRRGAGDGPVATGTTATSGGRRSRGALGAGLVDMPSVPYRDPVSALLADPQVPERKRFCGQCGGPVGRAHEGRPARGEGFCPACGTMYSFTPKLHPGDRVAGQYQVAGCIAHGGLGWIYLAQDRNVSDRWVVLKGLLDSRDESAMAAAIAERRFLAEVEHPNIVKIYNFVEHDGAGYIVMEYVGGQSLRETRNQCREETGAPLPVAHAIAYVLEILPAFRFLHRRDLLFCDFKPDNVIQTDEQLKLIDLGGVRARDDEDSDLYGTIGYQGPEVPDAGASVASDLYTLARTLAVLSIDIPGFSDERRHATSLPPVRDVPQFRHYEAFHQFLVKATAPDPAARFQSVDDLEDQLLGVLRQVVAIDGGSPAPAPSTHFSTELGFAADEGTWLNLPIPVVDPFDPAAAMLATVALSAPEQRRLILEASPRSPELALGLARSFIDEGALAEADEELESDEARGAGWRAAWWRGVLQLARDCPTDAVEFFAAVASELPGELAPKLALATAFERAAGRHTSTPSTPWAPSTPAASLADLSDAARYYGLVSATDIGCASAAFGLSRVRAGFGDRAGAAAALERIPTFSSAHPAAQVALCRVRCSDLAGAPPDLADLQSASDVLDRLSAEPLVRLTLARDLQGQVLVMLVESRVGPSDAVLGGAALREDEQRAALERTYRALARLAPSEVERVELVDRANASRPRTLT